MSNEAEDFFGNYENSNNAYDSKSVSDQKKDVPSSSFSRSLKNWRREALEASTSPDEFDDDDNGRYDTETVKDNLAENSPEPFDAITPVDTDPNESITFSYYSKNDARVAQVQSQPDKVVGVEDENITFAYYTRKMPSSKPPSGYSVGLHSSPGSFIHRSSTSDSQIQTQSNVSRDSSSIVSGEGYEQEDDSEEQQPESLTVTYYAKKTSTSSSSGSTSYGYHPPYQQHQSPLPPAPLQHQNHYSFPTRLPPLRASSKEQQQQYAQKQNSQSSTTSSSGPRGHVRQNSEVSRASSHASSAEAYLAYEQDLDPDDEGMYGYGGGGGRGDEEVVDFTGGGGGGAAEDDADDKAAREAAAAASEAFDYASYYDDYQFDEDDPEEGEEEYEEEGEEVYEEDAYIEEKMEEKDFDSPLPVKPAAQPSNSSYVSTQSPARRKKKGISDKAEGSGSTAANQQRMQAHKSFNRIECMPARRKDADETEEGSSRAATTAPTAVGGKNQDYLALARQYRLERPYQDPGYKAVCVLCKAALCGDVFFPCQHRCVCRGCIKKENICDERAMVNNPNGYCMCSLCASVIKLILPNEGGEEVEKYWQWVYEEPVELPPQFLKDFRHSASVIKAVYLDDDKEYRRMKGVKKDGDCIVS